MASLNENTALLDQKIQEELKRFAGNEQKLKEILKFLSVLKA